MIKLSIDIANLIRSLLPRHKRQPNRIQLLNGLTSPIVTLFKDFTRWQVGVRLGWVTSQVIVLENYLSLKYGAEIIIETSYDGGVEVSMRSEGRYHIDAGTDMFQEVHLMGEMQEYFENCDFVVHVPQTVTVESVRKDVERFRRAGKKVIIKQS